MRAAIYTRVSHDPNATLRSVEEQETECRQQCEREGWEVVRLFSDNDRSASRHARGRGTGMERPGYRGVQELIRRGEVDVLVMWEGSRAQRDMRDYLKLRDLCARHGVRYSYSGRVYDLTRTDDRFSTGLDALLAEREADVVRDRVLRGMRANARGGKVHGKLLYGYGRRYDASGQLVEQFIVDDQAAIVREAARRVARGETPHAVATDFNRRDIPAPNTRYGPACEAWDRGARPCPHHSCSRLSSGRWDLTAVRRMVINPAYAGHRVHKTKEEHERKPGAARPIVSKATWPAILDEKTWSRCVARMTDPARKTTRDVSMRWLLSNIATAPCGAPLRVSRGGSEDAAHYVCSRDSCVSIRAIGLDTYVWMVMTERLSRPDAAKAYPRPDDQDDAIATAEAEAADMRKTLKEVAALVAAKRMSPAMAADIEADLLPKIEDAERRSREAISSPVLAEVIAETTSAPDPARVLAGLPIGVRRNLVQMLLDVRVRPAGKGARYRDRNIEDPELARIDPARVIIERRK